MGWGLAAACRRGFAGVVVACEPTGHRWRVVVEQASRLGLEAVWAQPLLGRRAREAEDFTHDKSDDKDALLIARLTTQLHCYLPERPTAAWARLGHLGNRRVEQLTLATAAQQRLRDLLECGWPAALEVTRHPLDSLTWRAAMTVGRCDPARIRRLGFTRLPGRSPVSCPAGVGGDATCASCGRCMPPPAMTVGSHPSGPGRWTAAITRSAGTSSPGAGRAGAGRLQAGAGGAGRGGGPHGQGAGRARPGRAGDQHPRSVGGRRRGDPGRDRRPGPLRRRQGGGQARRPVPRDNASGAFAGKTTISSRGRPLLRLAAWRAVWGALPHNPVFAARYAHLTSRQHNRLSDGQARSAVAAALLRQLWVVCVNRIPWEPAVAGGADRKEVTDPAA